MALPVKNRLKRKTDIDRVFQERNAVKGAFLLIRYKKNDIGESRFAFIVSAKSVKKAVARNRIKRILTEAIRKYNLDLKKGYDVLITVRSTTDEETLLKEFRDLIIKTKLL